MTPSLAVVKVGGSLYDLPNLGPRLNAWLKQAPAANVLLVPGGGATADVIRDFDRTHELGQERAHWLALDALRLNAQMLSVLLPATVVEHWDQFQQVRLRDEGSQYFVLDAPAFASRDMRVHPEGALPHLWSVTSDSIAARVAVAFGADHLILLKSVPIPEGTDWEEAGERGFVDEWFARTIQPALPRLQVRAVNFRNWSP